MRWRTPFPNAPALHGFKGILKGDIRSGLCFSRAWGGGRKVWVLDPGESLRLSLPTPCSRLKFTSPVSFDSSNTILFVQEPMDHVSFTTGRRIPHSSPSEFRKTSQNSCVLAMVLQFPCLLSCFLPGACISDKE